MSETFEWFVGVDWGSGAHQVCLLNAQGQICGTRAVEHTAAAVHDAVRWIGERTGASPGAIAVGIETSRGVLVDALPYPSKAIRESKVRVLPNPISSANTPPRKGSGRLSER